MKTFKGKKITVLGSVKAVGDIAPDFTVLNSELEPASLSDYKEKYIVLNVVPSLDTSVCDLQTRTVNQELADNKDTLVLTISNDLPFAQSRWCGNSGIDNVITLSDYKDLDFANKYGVLIEENRLLARAIFVLNEKREIIYLEYLDEMGKHPNYDSLIEFMKNLPEA
ncbi:similar to peroxiredoxin [Alteracholeplasma palmae J233]|uniref:Similar to peroxiredoxin n=1 Tax=Alteracholeplasma palmae (strain ATCC 49389 / J233) TaxID=1318466 RepID=U4KKD8_ALTPJ|nr:thiol peroxidase [Alteracholeplasma palmae]CCV64052.1 similar to peroxiredoxin [Alteracholeplasma palmae J233]